MNHWQQGMGGTVIVAVLATAGSALHARGAPPPSRASLDLLVPTDELPPLASRLMREESERIWALAGVRLVWHLSEATVPPGVPLLRIVLIDDEKRPRRSTPTYVLGDFLAGNGVIRVSLGGARQAANDGNAPLRKPLQPFYFPRALGYVLGRAVAHEIGHSLLGRGHVEQGLMRARFRAGEMVDPWNAYFSLSAADEARLSPLFDDERAVLRVRGADRERPAAAAVDAVASIR